MTAAEAGNTAKEAFVPRTVLVAALTAKATTSPIPAAVITVPVTAIIATDIHDRVNYAVVNASLKIDKEQKLCLFNITIDTDICPVMEYFEIFLDRMVLCRKAADLLGLTFELIINDTRLL